MNNKLDNLKKKWSKIKNNKVHTVKKAKLKEEQGKRIKDGREILERRMKNWKIELTDDVFTKILHQFKLKTVGDLCELISDEKIDLLAIKNLLLPARSFSMLQKTRLHPTPDMMK